MERKNPVKLGQGATQPSASAYSPMRAQGAMDSTRKLSTVALQGQGATEYLVLLAVVLIIALVSVALLGFFPGMASDSRRSESQIYWQSASPIAIISAAATYNDGDSADEIILTLRNNGGSPVELVAVGPYQGTTVGSATHAQYGQISEAGKYQFFGPGWSSSDDTYYNYLQGTWGGYIAPPRGAGLASTSTATNVLEPGEEVTIGFSAPAHDQSSGASYFARTCNPYSQQLGTYPKASDYYEFPGFNIYYASRVEGRQGLLKKETGTKPLILPCTDSRVWR